ncbi:MAG: SPOR domain-containing protein [Longimicrobiales bacterium]|nr:SPOR domain-containing protein [Longimicrobiales bacterium]
MSAPGAAGLIVALVAASAISLSAQELDEVERLVDDGRVTDAREELLAWWEASWSDARRAEREHALWLRGRLTLDPAQASADFRRLIAEHPIGRFTDAALGRLGSLSAVAGDTLAAIRWYDLLDRDFPGSEAAERSRRWRSLNAEAITRARTRRAEDPGSGRSSKAEDASPTPEPVGEWTVQLGAFGERRRAENFAEQLRGDGYDVRVVRVEGSDLWRVRSGRFLDDEAARPLYDRMREAGYEGAIVKDADSERSGG